MLAVCLYRLEFKGTANVSVNVLNLSKTSIPIPMYNNDIGKDVT